MKLNHSQQLAKERARELAAQFNQTQDTNLIVEMKKILKINNVTLNKAGIPPEHIQLVKMNWDSPQQVTA